MVDFPQPLGPSSTMNSPSRISRLTPSTAVTLPKRLVRFLSVTLAIASPLYAAGGEAAHDISLHGEGDQHRQDVGHHAARHQQAEVDAMASGELRKCHRQGLCVVVCAENQGKE